MCMYVCMYVCMHACTHVHTRTHVSTHIHVCVCVCVWGGGGYMYCPALCGCMKGSTSLSPNFYSYRLNYHILTNSQEGKSIMTNKGVSCIYFCSFIFYLLACKQWKYWNKSVGSLDLETGCLKLAVVQFVGVKIFKGDHNILIFQP